MLQYLMDPRPRKRAAAGSVRQAGRRRRLGKAFSEYSPDVLMTHREETSSQVSGEYICCLPGE